MSQSPGRFSTVSFVDRCGDRMLLPACTDWARSGGDVYRLAFESHPAAIRGREDEEQLSPHSWLPCEMVVL